MTGQGWYYLIDLDVGRTILKCPGAQDQAATWELASKHLKLIRRQLDTEGRVGNTVADSEGRTATLVGVYRPYTAREEMMMPKSFGFRPNLLGSIDEDPLEWKPVT